MPSQRGQGAKARHVLVLAGEIPVAVIRDLLWPVALVRPAPASRPVGIKARKSSPSDLAFHADKEPIPSCCDITGSERRFGAFSAPFGLC